MKSAEELAMDLGLKLHREDWPVMGPRELAVEIRAIQADALRSIAVRICRSDAPYVVAENIAAEADRLEGEKP